MERSSGMRKMQTFRKLPITNPSTKMKAMTKVRAAQAPTCNVPYRQCALNATARWECPMPNAVVSRLRAELGELLISFFLEVPSLQ